MCWKTITGVSIPNHIICFHFSFGPGQDEKESKARSESYMKNGEVIKNL